MNQLVKLQNRILYSLIAVAVFLAQTVITQSATAAAHVAYIPHKTIKRETPIETSLSSSTVFGVSDTALKFVLVTGIHKNLSLLLLHEVKNDDLVQTAIKRYGFDKVQNIVVKAIRAAKSDHAAEWNEMLAGVYNKHFSDAELRSIIEEREASPYFSDLIGKQAVIAKEAKLNGKDIFLNAETEVLKRIGVDLPA